MNAQQFLSFVLLQHPPTHNHPVDNSKTMILVTFYFVMEISSENFLDGLLVPGKYTNASVNYFQITFKSQLNQCPCHYSPYSN